MESLDEGLRARVDELTRSSRSPRQPLLSTTGTQAAIAQLVERCDALERALGELAHELETVSAAQKSGTTVAPPSVR